MRALVTVTPGRVIPCEPSLGVAAARTVGNVAPPSVESRMSTKAVLTGATFVLATSHVTVCAPDHETFVLGLVTRNGPAAVETVRIAVSAFTPPPPERLSRTVKRRSIVRAAPG